MLLIVGRSGDAGNNSKHGAESVVHAINCVRHPTATAPMPAFAFQNGVEHRARTELRHHRLERARVCFFFDRAFAEKIFHIMFAGENALSLIAKRSFMFFFGRFHSANRDLGPERTVQPSLSTPPERIGNCRNWLAEIGQFFCPALRMTFLRFRHAKKNSFALLIRFATGKSAIRLRGLDFSAPVALYYFDGLSPARRSFGGGGSILSRFGFHRPHSVSIAAVIGGSDFDLSCCTVMIRATEPMINAAASRVRKVTVSWANKAPSKTATIGLT